MHNFRFELGMEATDVVTGFTGYITWRVQYLTGCDQYGLQPKTNKIFSDKAPEAQQFDENRIKLTGKKISLPIYKEPSAPGGPQHPVLKTKIIK